MSDASLPHLKHRRAQIFALIDAERDHQESLGYTREHDVDHGGLEHLWRYSGRYSYAGLCAHQYDNDKMRAKNELIKSAAILVAAIELLDSES